MAALSFGHLPSVVDPPVRWPAACRIKKVRIASRTAEGKVDRMALLESEAASYHAPGTCTFYGTANTNQMVVEFMGMQLPGLPLCPSGCSAAGSADRRRRAPGHPHDRQRQ